MKFNTKIFGDVNDNLKTYVQSRIENYFTQLDLDEQFPLVDLLIHEKESNMIRRMGVGIASVDTQSIMMGIPEIGIYEISSIGLIEFLEGALGHEIGHIKTLSNSPEEKLANETIASNEIMKMYNELVLHKVAPQEIPFIFVNLASDYEAHTHALNLAPYGLYVDAVINFKNLSKMSTIMVEDLKKDKDYELVKKLREQYPLITFDADLNRVLDFTISNTFRYFPLARSGKLTQIQLDLLDNVFRLYLGQISKLFPGKEKTVNSFVKKVLAKVENSPNVLLDPIILAKGVYGLVGKFQERYIGKEILKNKEKVLKSYRRDPILKSYRNVFDKKK